jgi:hypothetical protein
MNTNGVIGAGFVLGPSFVPSWSDCESRRGRRWTEETDDCSKSSVGAQLGEIHPFISDGTVHEQSPPCEPQEPVMHVRLAVHEPRAGEPLLEVDDIFRRPWFSP